MKTDSPSLTNTKIRTRSHCGSEWNRGSYIYKSYFVFCILMRPAISYFNYNHFQFFVKKKFSIIYYTPIGVYYPNRTFLQPVKLTIIVGFATALANHYQNCVIKESLSQLVSSLLSPLLS